jgi:hypothetical protein
MSEGAKVITKKPEAKSEESAPKAQEAECSQPTNSRYERILFLQKSIGNQAVQRLFKSSLIQSKLQTGKPGDIYEREADRLADRVMRMAGPQVQRQAEKEEKEELIQPLSERVASLVRRQEEEKEETLQAKGGPGQSSEVASNVQTNIASARGGGQPLPESSRSYFEPRFGHDLSQVRVHSDSRAATTSRQLNARAFTVGKDIVFGAGQYTPGTHEGKRLFAHELTHVLQRTKLPSVCGKVEKGTIPSTSLRISNQKSTLQVQARFGDVPATPGWAAQVTAAKRAHTELALLNEIITTRYPDIPSRFPHLRFPVMQYQEGSEVEGGVYFDPALSDFGITTNRTDTTGGGCSGCSCEPERTTTITFIILGPDALSEGTPKFSEYVLYHEYVHYLQRTNGMHRTLLAGSTRTSVSVHRDALAHAESFRHYFGQLQWEGQTFTEGGLPAEAINSLVQINRRYYVQSDDSIRAEVIRLVTSVVSEPDRSDKLRFLRDLINRLRIEPYTERSIFREDMTRAINHL